MAVVPKLGLFNPCVENNFCGKDHVKLACYENTNFPEELRYSAFIYVNPM